MRFFGISHPAEFRDVTCAHVIAWRDDLKKRGLSVTTICRKRSALSALFAYMTERNSVLINPVDGVRRPKEGAREGHTPALGDGQARRLLEAPDTATLKGMRDRALLSVFLFHGLWCGELARLKVEDLHERGGITSQT